MNNRIATQLAALLFAAVTSAVALAAQPGKPQAVALGPGCDRECLRSHVTQVLWALANHDVSKLRVADTLRVTEDADEKKLKDIGLLRTVTKLQGFRQDFIDERTGVVGAHTMVEES